MTKLYVYVIILALTMLNSAFAQDCQSTIVIQLDNITNGSLFSGQKVVLTSFRSKKVYTNTTDFKGEASFLLPCEEKFNVTISNYVGKIELMSPPYANSTSTQTFSYAADMLEKSKAFAMNDVQKKVVDRAITHLPDTTYAKAWIMRQPHDLENYSTLDITLIGLEKQFLEDEEIVFTGRKRNKSFKANTNAKGRARFYLPKGDIYNVNFKYHGNYSIEEVVYSKGTSSTRVEITYMGTKEFLRRKKAEEKRMELERQQALLAKAAGNAIYNGDLVLETVMNRNDWKNKLLITDVSYEMLAYALKLAIWYEANRKADQTTQFVLYNNGKKQQNSESGVAFHMVSPEYQTLVDKINYVYDNVGLETAAHSIEGLIAGDGIAKTYDDVILFVDKDAGLMDYEYFKQLKAPVHVVLCVDDRRANPQHLTIAWKTKGSVHSLSGDYTNIGQLVEGDTFEMEGAQYKIMGGEFVSIY
ncbi:MAG: hypothetical protein GQ574_07220 [Crocinitomix sp.]|nr:hypothetical protein [Crocinitomix sp.]